MKKSDLREAINYKFLMIKLSACKTKAEMRDVINDHFEAMKKI